MLDDGALQVLDQKVVIDRAVDDDARVAMVGFSLE